ncbi:uncharacterized protein LOC135927506 [Gordionus sp. m RMFG-2023]|uniref:uncharacterized protein LOC135927506 n=1 Tax=Gordionus sp. m RMFG-2023 TaxID=3053472 RepID=UPI0031FCE088
MKLKQEVSYKVEKSHKSVSCLQEIFNLLACLKKNDFSQEYCDIEIKGFQTCYDDHKNTLAKQKIENENIIALSGKTRYPTKQLNKLLRKYLNLNHQNVCHLNQK